MFARSVRELVVDSIAIAVVIGVAHVACGGPVDPGAPVAPESGVGEGSSACFGVADGTACPGGKLCVRGVCSASTCGDGVVTPPEECDLGALNGPGAGCEATCKWTCLTSDPARSCQVVDGCLGSGACDDASHTCKPGGPKPTGASCGPSKFCRGTECVPGACGDAVVTPPETCDNGNANGPGTGCEADCTTSCVNPAACPAVPCNTPTCGADLRCSTTPDPSQDGKSCGANLFCKTGACLAPGAVCGNGILEGGEECDLGAGNGPGTGCESICKFSCKMAPGSCVDPNACHEAPTCSAVTVDGKKGQKCVTGATKAEGSVCGIGSLCLGGTCKPSACGDGFRDDARSEQCDDGNVTKLDGCSDQCAFEQDQRVIAMNMQWDVDTYCTVNALGGAIANVARKSFQDNIDASIKDGSVSALFTFAGDLAGRTGAVTVGNLSGTPSSSTPPYDGTKDLDAWYGPTVSSIDASRTARALLTGAYAGGTVDATGRLNLITSVGGQIASLAVSGAKIRTASGAASVPTLSTNNASPGHLAVEHLSPTVQSFATAGGSLGAPTGQMCGNIAAASLENTAPPASLLPGGANACNEKYSTSNRMIDIIVRGCRVTLLNLVAIKPTQPDQTDPSAPVAGAGPPYKLATDPTTKRVTACRDKADAVVPLQTCLNAAAYSMSFKYATDRVIIR